MLERQHVSWNFDAACGEETDPSPTLARRGIGHVAGGLPQRP